MQTTINLDLSIICQNIRISLSYNYHIIPELVVEEMCGHMWRQQIEKYPSVTALQFVHICLLFVCLRVPQEVEPRGPLHLPSMDQNGHNEVYDHHWASYAKRNAESEFKFWLQLKAVVSNRNDWLVSALEESIVSEFNDNEEDGCHWDKKRCFKHHR